MINHRAWFAARRKLLSSVKAEVRRRLGPGSAALASYAKRIDREYRGPWRAVNEAELVRTCRRVGLVLGADFHAYAQAQRAFVRVLRDNFGPKDRVMLALECVREEQEAACAAYLAGEMDEDRFLARVRWTRDWGFPWAHYKPFFDLARERGWRIAGLGSPATDRLSTRDRRVASKLRALAADAGQLTFAVMGEWHWARSHVPRHLNRPAVLLLQDVEPLYLARAGRGRRPLAETWRAPGDRFCLMVSPPWMRWQSYLMYLDHSYDRALAGEVDFSDHVASLVTLLEHDLGVSVPRARVQVYGPGSDETLRRRARNQDPSARRALGYYVRNQFNFVWPEADWLYLGRPTINHAASLAGQFVHGFLSHRTRSTWRGPGDLHALVWIEAVGFFFSKWINPRRKADTLDSVRSGLEGRLPPPAVRRVLTLVLDQRLSDVIRGETRRVRKQVVRAGSVDVLIEASRVLGSMLGERLFQKVRAGSISLPRLMSYLKMDVEQAEFESFYRRLNQDLT